MGLKLSKQSGRHQSERHRGSGSSVDPQDYPEYQKHKPNEKSSVQLNDSKHDNSTISSEAQFTSEISTPIEQPVIVCESQSALASPPAKSSVISDDVRASTDFPFLVDPATIEYIKSAKVMFIMRGLSGSGKSTIVGLLKETYPQAVSCSADDFFMVDGIYQFDQNKLSDAHSTCQSKANIACKQDIPVVVIDNTNVRKWEMNTYHGMATRWHYNVVHIIPRTPWAFDPEELTRRNKHGVPKDILVRKVAMFDAVYPVYFGWFLRENDSHSLLNLGEHLLQQCLNHVPEFAAYMGDIGAIEDAATFRFGDLYNREDSSSDAVLHCTAFFAGSGRAPGCKDYSSRIQDSVGKVFKLCVIGVVVTPRTVGLRIRLSSEQLELWGKDDYDGYESSSPHHCEMVCQYHHGQAHSQFHPTCGYGSRAHVTLGYARGYGAVQAGHDQMDVLNCEVDSFDDHNHVVIPEGALKYYGEGKCVVYLNKPLEYRTLFGGRYTGN